MFSELSFWNLGFISKFIRQNKESFERLILKNVHIEALRIISLSEALADNPDQFNLQVIHLENVNLNKKSLKSLIIHCKQMTKLKEFSLINMP